MGLLSKRPGLHQSSTPDISTADISTPRLQVDAPLTQIVSLPQLLDTILVPLTASSASKRPRYLSSIERSLPPVQTDSRVHAALRPLQVLGHEQSSILAVASF
jgi:hypothetical protein